MKKLSRGLVVVFLAAALPAFAHPHVFVNNKMTVVFDGGMLQGISFTWTFDEMFSNMILADYDPKHTGQFNAAQVKAVKAGAVEQGAQRGQRARYQIRLSGCGQSRV